MLSEYLPPAAGREILISQHPDAQQLSASLDFRLAVGSPCLPGGNSCEVLIGVYGLGCAVVTAVDGVATPKGVSLDQNHPNPFNPFTEIAFSLAIRQPVRLDVFDVTGRRVASLLSETLPAGPHEVTWNGRDDAGRRLASGTYFYRLTTTTEHQTRRMLLLK